MAWNYRADPPQRYSSNYRRYLERGGIVQFEEDVAGFVGGGRNNGDMARYFFFCLALDQIMKEELPGDLAELGVYKGETATLIATIARRLGKTAWLLDTFEGFDPKDLAGIDYGQNEHFHRLCTRSRRRGKRPFHPRIFSRYNRAVARERIVLSRPSRLRSVQAIARCT